MRMTRAAPIVHLPQSMQMSGSQIGISTQWPLLIASRAGRETASTGRADTGNRSPLPSMSIEVTCLTKSGPTRGRLRRWIRRRKARPGSRPGPGWPVRIDGGEVAVHDGVPRLHRPCYRRLDLGNATSAGNIPRGEEARLHHRVDRFLVGLLPRPSGIDHPELNVLVLYLALHLGR